MSTLVHGRESSKSWRERSAAISMLMMDGRKPLGRSHSSNNSSSRLQQVLEFAALLVLLATLGHAVAVASRITGEARSNAAGAGSVAPSATSCLRAPSARLARARSTAATRTWWQEALIRNLTLRIAWAPTTCLRMRFTLWSNSCGRLSSLCACFQRALTGTFSLVLPCSCAPCLTLPTRNVFAPKRLARDALAHRHTHHGSFSRAARPRVATSWRSLPDRAMPRHVLSWNVC